MARDGEGLRAHNALTATPVGGYDATSFDAVTGAMQRRRDEASRLHELSHELVVEVVPFGITIACDDLSQTIMASGLRRNAVSLRRARLPAHAPCVWK